MTLSPSSFLPPLPEGLEDLTELALDLKWSWSHGTDALWERIDPELWAQTRNPWLLLQSVGESKLRVLAAEGAFRAALRAQAEASRTAREAPGWFRQVYREPPLTAIAYLSMEFGLGEALPIYSGGLGILAGDYLKAASDLGLPVAGVGLLYQQGYFRQALDAQGAQMEFFPYNDPNQLPVVRVRGPGGEWLRVEIELPGRTLLLRTWVAQVGRVRLYLLDSNDPLNLPSDRGITSELYGGGPELRLQQEVVLGIGGWRLLAALGIRAEMCHLNEGHAAFAVLERARSFMAESRQPFPVALTVTRAGNLFTTHTPVAAGFDRFPPGLVAQYLEPYADALGIGIDGLLGLGRGEAGRPPGAVQHGLPGHPGQRGRQRGEPTPRRGEPSTLPAALPPVARARGARGSRHERRPRADLGFGRGRRGVDPGLRQGSVAGHSRYGRREREAAHGRGALDVSLPLPPQAGPRRAGAPGPPAGVGLCTG